MIGGAAQNAIALTDSVFLYHKSVDDFAAIGFISVFYLIIATVGYSYCRGGQILIARYLGRKDLDGVRKNFQALFIGEFFLSIVAFLFMCFGAYWVCAAFVGDQTIFDLSLDYLETRSFGVFAAYLGMSFIAFYSGIGRTVSLLWATIALFVTNVTLDYALIFGHFGFEAMGIKGAGLASTISEYVALAVFFVFALFDKDVKYFSLFKFSMPAKKTFAEQWRLSVPLMAQSIIGLGSWLFFFGIIENLGTRALAITNLVRVVYLALSVPTWGFSTAMGTFSSHFLGRGMRDRIIPLSWKISHIAALITLFLGLLVAVFPETFLYPIFGAENMDLVKEAQPIFFVITLVVLTMSYAITFFSSLTAAGAIKYGLVVQSIAAILYVILIYIIIEGQFGGLVEAWSSELVYWVLLLFFSYRGLQPTTWKGDQH